MLEELRLHVPKKALAPQASTPMDVTLASLRVEHFFTADAATKLALKAAADEAAGRS